MKPRKTIYLFHRWLGLIVCIQLVAWSAGGLIFSLLDIRSVRGETDSAMAVVPLPPSGSAAVTSDAARQNAIDAGLQANNLSAISLRDRGLGPRYELYDLEGLPLCAVDAITGNVITLLTAEQAKAIALADFVPSAQPLEATLIEGDAKGEFRGKRTPAWRIDLDHTKNPHIYIDAITGQVLARRNDNWRIFDFFWMLHIMDYTKRENFNHPLLTASSALALLTGISGISLWGWRAKSRWKRHTAA